MENNFQPILLWPVCLLFLIFLFLFRSIPIRLLVCNRSIPKYSDFFILVSISPVVDTCNIVIIYTFGDFTIRIWWTVLLTRWNWAFFPFELFLAVHCKTTNFTHSSIISLSVMFWNWSAIISIEMVVGSLNSSIFIRFWSPLSLKA